MKMTLKRCFILAELRWNSADITEAASNFNKLIADHSDYDQAYYFLGESYGKLGNLARCSLLSWALL
jgi:hypothetical protein